VKPGHARSLGLLAGVTLDAALADPRRAHPVAAFGTAAEWLEHRFWSDSRSTGAAFTAIAAGSVATAGWAIERFTNRYANSNLNIIAVALATWTVLGATSLRREAAAVDAHLNRGDLPAARKQLTHLVGRDPSNLDEAEIARAAVESVAENTSDAVVAPLFWGAIAGVPGLLGYRAVNTLDAMVGHRSPRYRNFGWSAARLDDLANLVPARVTAALTALVAPVVGGRPAFVARIARRDGRKHPSPNAGWCEAAFAAALGVRLGGTNTYGTLTEIRPTLGDGANVRPADLARANRLNSAICAAAVLGASAIALRAGRSESR
jgi:adenosylcobinamide-phosphate synthase